MERKKSDCRSLDDAEFCENQLVPPFVVFLITPPLPAIHPVVLFAKKIALMVVEVLGFWLDQVFPESELANTVPFEPATQPVLAFTNDIDFRVLDVLVD